jgi:prepilin-type N-terminal cleavage/methylation domain-containing protein
VDRIVGFRAQQGLSLLEMSITLLVVGLIVSMMVRGEELIVQTRIKAVAADFNGLRIAVATYQDRYARFPGDDDGAARWSGFGVTPVSGNPDGQLTGVFNAAPSNPPLPTEETNLFWWHLRLSQILVGPIDAVNGPRQPSNFLGGIIGVQAPLAGTLGLPNVVACSTSLPVRVAAAVDLNLDEGRATTGDMRGIRMALTGGGIPAVPAAGNYDESSGEDYAICMGITR